MTKAIKMEQVLKQWEPSGLSLRAFGKREEIPYSRLLYWKKKLRPSKVGSMQDAPELLPVKVVPDEVLVSGERLQLTAWLPNGVSIDVPIGFDENELRRMVGVLAGC